MIVNLKDHHLKKIPHIGFYKWKKKLTENLKGSTISKTEWENFYGPRTHVGYDAYWNQVHICQDTQNNPKTLIYAFNTKAFTESNKLYASDHKTGFVNNSEGHLLWAQIGTGSNSVTTNSNNSPGFKDILWLSFKCPTMFHEIISGLLNALIFKVSVFILIII